MKDNSDNTMESWNERFSSTGRWDAVNGDGLTRRFAECILERLAGTMTEVYLSQEGRTILDWGCARGLLVELFMKRFPRAEVKGLDFSIVAITEAVQRYGEHFIWTPDGSIDQMWDAIVTSNVMEHLVNPLVTLRLHLAMTRGVYVILTPFEEDIGGPAVEAMTPLERSRAGYQHVQRFTRDSFPPSMSDTGGRFWVRTIEDPTITPGEIWPGQQLLVVYERVQL